MKRIHPLSSLNRKQERELELYFSQVQASLTKKFIVTVLDLIYLLLANLPIFIFIAYYESGKNLISTFHEVVNRTKTVSAHRCLIFSIWMLFVCYIYFVVAPAHTNYQTFFSNNLGIKAVPLEIKWNKSAKIRHLQLLRANFLPVLVLPLLNIAFFSGAAIKNDSNWSTTLIKNSNSDPWVGGVRALIAVIFFLQIYHLFTVGASKKALNWFVRGNGIIYVDMHRVHKVWESEDKVLPTQPKMVLDLPGVSDLSYETFKNAETTFPEKSEFAQNINTSPVK